MAAPAMKYVPFRIIRCCPICNSFDVRRSHREGLFEVVILRLFLLRLFRCEKCGRRHYNFFFSRKSAVGEQSQAA
jgi:hypothetical protein